MAKLPNAPLQEVIFELRWSLLPTKDLPQQTDVGFELASGRLQAKIEDKFPVYRRIVPQHVPDQILQYQVVHQYWTGENKWPVIQLGPGIFTVNCTEDDYDWDSQFRPLIAMAVQWLIDAYKTPLAFQYANLKYIDVITVDDYGGIKDGWRNFVERYFNIQYRNNFDTGGIEKGIQISQTFTLPDGSDLVLQFSNGVKGGNPAFVWQTSIAKKSELKLKEDILNWADSAHTTTHKIFKDIVSSEMYDSFTRANNGS